MDNGNRPLRVLIAEDRRSDAELIVHALERAGYRPDWSRVENEADFLAQLQPGLDLILSDYEMPQFGGMRALDLLRQSELDVPFILISGTIGEETAVAAMKGGAADYLLKDRLSRLGAAVEQALANAALRRERRQTREALHLFRALVDQSSDIFVVVDPPTGRFLDVNEQGTAELRCSREEFLALRVCDLDPTISEEFWPQQVERIRESGLLKAEGLLRRRDGSSFPIEYHAKWVRLEREYIVAMVRDVTERRRAEAHLREQASMLDHAHEAIIVRDLRTGCATFWNRGAERLYGWTAAEALGRTGPELTQLDSGLLETISKPLLASGEWHGEVRQRSKSGQELTVLAHASLVRDAEGEPKSVLVINIDLTAQKDLEARFLRAQRLESIGTLASGVAHDLNNILAPILMSAPLLRLDLPAEQRDRVIDTIQLSAERGAGIIKQVLTFGRGLASEKSPLQLTPLIRELVRMMRETFPRNLTIEESLAPGLWSVLGDATQLHQVLLNLCVNARDSMPRGGQLKIAGANLLLDASFSSMLPDSHPGPYLRLEVSDTGTGIASAHLERIFDPFFTTKSVGSGTGLGLSTVLGIVKNHGGFVHVETAAGKGSTFQVYLPASPDLDSAPRAAETKAIPRGQGELLLLADDETHVREVARIALETSGYKVLEASDGVAAMAAFAMNSRRIALVLTDLMMPEMDGVSLIRGIRAMSPHMPIIASTGLRDKAQLSELRAQNVHTVLEKPYSAETLLRSVHETLGTGGKVS